MKLSNRMARNSTHMKDDEISAEQAVDTVTYTTWAPKHSFLATTSAGGTGVQLNIQDTALFQRCCKKQNKTKHTTMPNI